MVKLLNLGNGSDLMTATLEGRRELQREGKLLLDLTPSLGNHLHHVVMQELSDRAELEAEHALFLCTMIFSLRVARHEASHTAALVLLHDPSLYTLDGAEFQFPDGDSFFELFINEQRESIFLLSGGGVRVTFVEGVEAALAAITTIQAPDYLEPPLTFIVEGQAYRHGGMGESDHSQETRIRKLLIGAGIPATESLATAKQRLEEDPEKLLRAIDSLASYFYTHLATGQARFSREEIMEILTPHS